MYYLRRKIFSITVITSLLVITTTLINYFDTTIHSAYGQAIQRNSNSNNNNNNNTNANSLNIQNILAKKVHVGDIDIVYKLFGKGDPILLISGASAGMNSWDPSTLRSLSSNHTVIVFDSRGVGNTTTGTKPFTIQQLANDTASLLYALKIQKADVLGYSLGSFIAQQFTFTYPDMINRLILVASSCGGKDSIPPPRQIVKLQSEILNKSLNNIPIIQEEIKSLTSLSLGSGWVRLHPYSLKDIPEAQDVFASVSPNTIKQQFNIGENWMSTRWNGACDKLAKIGKPILLINGTDDNAYVPLANSLIIAGKIQGAWLVQIKDAGHAVMSQYPDKINKILQIFLSTTTSHS